MSPTGCHCPLASSGMRPPVLALCSETVVISVTPAGSGFHVQRNPLGSVTFNLGPCHVTSMLHINEQYLLWIPSPQHCWMGRSEQSLSVEFCARICFERKRFGQLCSMKSTSFQLIAPPSLGVPFLKAHDGGKTALF
jgi:hypothetical protein